MQKFHYWAVTGCTKKKESQKLHKLLSYVAHSCRLAMVITLPIVSNGRIVIDRKFGSGHNRVSFPSLVCSLLSQSTDSSWCLALAQENLGSGT